jgi:predicted GTPase
MSYEAKFAGLLKLCADARASGVDVVAIHHPEVLGDDYTEIVESLNRIADAGLALQIIPRAKRKD